MNDKLNNDVKFLNSISSFLGHSEGQTVEEVKEELERNGINVNLALKRFKDTAKRSSDLSKKKQLDLAREKRLAEKDLFSSIATEVSSFSREMVEAKIMEITNLFGQKLRVSFRDLNGKSMEDLRTLLIDLEISSKEHGNDK